MKRKKPTKKADSRTGTEGLSSQSADVNYLLEQISPGAIGKLWNKLRDSAKDAKWPTMWVLSENGTISKADYRVVVIACTTDAGFALRFIANDTST